MYNTALSLAQLTANHTAGPDAIPVTGTLPATTAVAITGGATLDINGATQLVGSLAGLGGTSVTLGAGSLSAGSDNSSSTFAGVMSGTGSFTKEGTGSLVLTAANTYTGTTTVNGGALYVNGSATSATTVNANGTLRGTGSITGTLSVNSTGTIWPGIALSGNVTAPNEKLTVTGLVPTGTPKLKITANPTNAQQLVVTGGTPFSLAGSVLSLGINVNNYVNTKYVVLDATAGAANNITAGFGSFTVNGGAQATVTVDYLDAANNANASVAALPGGAANRVRITINGAVTPVTMDALSAKAEGAGSLVEWKLASEYRNIGFNLYRRDASLTQDSAWARVNAELIPGRISDPSAHTYRYYDWAPAGVYEYRLEHVDVGGAGEFYSELTAPIAINGLEPALLSVAGLDTALNGLVTEVSTLKGAALSRKLVEAQSVATVPQKQIVAAEELLAISAGSAAAPLALLNSSGQPANSANVRNIVSSSPRGAYATASRGTTGSALNAPAVLPRSIPRPSSSGSRTAAKAEYVNPGVLLVPRNQLPIGMNASKLSITREGRPVTALALTSAGVLLYGPGYEDQYTNKDAFFLSPTGGATAAGTVLNAQGLFNGANAVRSVTLSSTTEQYHDMYFDWSLRPYDYPPYFSSHYLTQGGTASFALILDHTSGGTASLTVNAWSLTNADGVTPDHALQAFVNGTPVGQATWTGGGRFVELTFDVPAGALTNGNNAIDLVTPALPGVAQQIALVHSITVACTKDLAGPGAVEVNHSGNRNQMYEVSKLPTSTLWVVDARYPDRAALVPYETQAQADGLYSARFTAQPGGTGKYLVVPAGSENLPLSVTKRAIKPLTAGLQYVATGPSQFAGSVESLVMQRSKEGLKGAFVDQEQLFDYYNYGRYGPDGIRNAVRSTRPQYLLLAGRTSSDYHDYSGAGANPLCPTYLVSTTFWSQATSDSMYGDLGRGYPEVKVGRIPANTAGECAVAVRRILSNAGLPPSGYRGHFTADVADQAAGDFAAEAESVIAANPDMPFTRNYLGITYQNADDVTASMAQAANGGADVLFYNGHGSAARLGATVPRILDTDTVQAWQGNVVLIATTCTFNWVAKAESDYRSIPIQAMVQPQGGIAASIGVTTYMNSIPGTEFTKQLVTQVHSLGSGARWGDVLLRSQQWAFSQSGGDQEFGSWYMDLSKTECILGDPAMPVYGKQHGSKPVSGGAPQTGTPPATVSAPGQF
jgi:autotransporter-associated beta strand protein